jgi:hypothetical protein
MDCLLRLILVEDIGHFALALAVHECFEADGPELVARDLLVDSQPQGVHRLLGGSFGL